MGGGTLLSPHLAARMGKIQLVVATQSLSIPFLIIMYTISTITYWAFFLRGKADRNPIPAPGD